jgi:hypothetical protein
MSLRQRRADVPLVTATSVAHSSRLHFTLMAGLRHHTYGPPPEPIEPVGDGGAMGDMYANSARKPDDPRSILVIKGLTFGVPPEIIDRAVSLASQLIDAPEKKVTTVCWDGDPFSAVGPEGQEKVSSFVDVVVKLKQVHPDLEFIYFKKEEGVQSLFADVMPARRRDEKLYRKTEGKVDQWLAPIPFMTTENTVVLSPISILPPLAPGRNIAIAMDDGLKWDQLGLKGLQWLKQKNGIMEIKYMTVGTPGYALGREIGVLDAAKTTRTYYALYPEGASSDKHIQIPYDRPK